MATIMAAGVSNIAPAVLLPKLILIIPPMNIPTQHMPQQTYPMVFARSSAPFRYLASLPSTERGVVVGLIYLVVIGGIST